MTVFNMVLKLIKSQLRVIFVYLFIFMSVFIIFNQMNAGSDSVGFTSTKIKIAVVDEDRSNLSQHLYELLESKHTIIDVGERQEDLNDAMYFGQIAYAIVIPEGFEASFLNQQTIPLQTQEVLNSSSYYLVESLISTYLQKMELLYRAQPTASIEELHQETNEILHQNVEVVMDSENIISQEAVALDLHFNYLSYIFIALIILIGGMVMMQLYQPEVRKRQLVSPVSNVSFNLQLWLAGILCVLAFWAIFMVEVQLTVGGLLTQKGLFYAINALLFAFVAMGITLLIGAIIAGKRHGEEVLDGCANVLGLGFSFLGGAFVPQYLLSDQVKIIGSFTPTFWYVKTNDALLNAQSLTPALFQDILVNYGVLVLFIIVSFLLALFILKTKASSEDLS